MRIDDCTVRLKKVLYMITDFWKDQYKRVIRHRKYIFDLLDINNELAPVLHDAYINFFIHCYGLKYWLKQSGFKSAVKYCHKNDALNTCGGLANASKHFALEDDDYKNQYFRFFYKTNTLGNPSILNYSSTGSAPSDTILPTIQPKTKLEIGDYIIESSIIPSITAYNLMNSCIYAWNSYLIKEGIDINNI